MENKSGKLEKLIALPNGEHPYVQEGKVKDGIVFFEPEVNSVCMVASLRTSMIEEIVKTEGNEVLFRTKNSLYRLTYDS